MQTVSRLIDFFTPEHYQLSLTIERVDRRFSGVITMNGFTPENVHDIRVHAKDLTVTSVTLDGKSAEFHREENDELVITHPDIKMGRHVVVIAYGGDITDGMHGMYPCYFDHDGTKKELIATQFESHHAREVFPCIDEPEAKATFDVSLTTEQSITVLGNMPIAHQRVEDGKLVTTFDTTPRMSTYLLAWVTGELHRKTAVTKSGVEVNVWATVAQDANSLDHALEVATRTIDFFNDYFGTPYPLPKSDHVALPDFGAGAMENWGLITYREITLLADPKTASISAKQYVAIVVAHELSHQWFGNLVTMKWWNDLWLNESFANFMEYVAIDALYPEWDMWLEFSRVEVISALRRDSLAGVQAIRTDVHHPDEIGTLFDPAIVYAKGARLLRMLHQYIGEEAFRSGLQAYFKTHQYSNTTGEDLWKALGAASGKNIPEFMNAWISQPGFPVVMLSQTDDNLTLSQQQFFIGPHSASDALWPIPLNASISELPEILSERTIAVPKTPSSEVRLNVGNTAHFISSYDETLRERLIESIKSNLLTPLDRLQLLNEQTLLARGGVVPSSTLIPLVAVYENETQESVWGILALAVSDLKRFVETDVVAENQLKKFVGRLSANLYQEIGWTQRSNESETTTKLRAVLVGLTLYSENADAIQTALSLFRGTNIDDINPELRPYILSTVVKYSEDSSEIESLIALYKTTPNANLRKDIALGLAATQDKTRIEQLLSFITDGTVRQQDVIHWIVQLLQNRVSRAATWRWIRANWDWIETRFAGDKSYDYFPRYSASFLATREQLQEYRDFFIPMQSEIALARTISIGLIELEGKVELIERDTAAVIETLKQL
jgi:aminopeptidase N